MVGLLKDGLQHNPVGIIVATDDVQAVVTAGTRLGTYRPPMPPRQPGTNITAPPALFSFEETATVRTSRETTTVR